MRLPSSIAAAALGLWLAAAPALAQDGPRTLSLDGAASPPASLADAAWLVGRWTGEGLGAEAEELYLAPAGGAMPGLFRLTRADGTVMFYEILLLLEQDGSLVYRLKHFHPDLAGWEERTETVDFPLVRADAEGLWFDGLTFRRLGPDAMEVWVRIGGGEAGPREARFSYVRAGPELSGAGSR